MSSVTDSGITSIFDMISDDLSTFSGREANIPSMLHLIKVLTVCLLDIQFELN